MSYYFQERKKDGLLLDKKKIYGIIIMLHTSCVWMRGSTVRSEWGIYETDTCSR